MGRETEDWSRPKHDWHLFCVISWRGKCRCTYLASRVWSTGCFCITNPLNTERLKNLFVVHVAGFDPEANPQIWPHLTAQGHLNITGDRVRVTDAGITVPTALLWTYLWSRWQPGQCLCPLLGAVAGKLPRSRWEAWAWTDSVLAWMANWLRSQAAPSGTPPSPLWRGLQPGIRQMLRKQPISDEPS